MLNLGTDRLEHTCSRYSSRLNVTVYEEWS